MPKHDPPGSDNRTSSINIFLKDHNLISEYNNSSIGKISKANNLMKYSNIDIGLM